MYSSLTTVTTNTQVNLCDKASDDSLSGNVSIFDFSQLLWKTKLSDRLRNSQLISIGLVDTGGDKNTHRLWQMGGVNGIARHRDRNSFRVHNNYKES